MSLLIKPKPNWREIPSPLPYESKAYRWGDLSVFIALEDGCWHMSIANPFRYPSWEEIKAARYDLLPDNITMAMLLPPSKDYVNVHQNCFHLWQVPNETGLH